MTTMTADDGVLTVSDAMANYSWLLHPFSVEEDEGLGLQLEGLVRNQSRELAHDLEPPSRRRTSSTSHPTHLPHNFDTTRPIYDDVPLSIASSVISDNTTTTTTASSESSHTFGGDNLDLTFLDSLDEQLLHHPTHSFATLCWEEAVQEDTVTPSRSSFISDTSSEDSGDTVIFRGGGIISLREATLADSREKLPLYSVEELPYVNEKPPVFDPTPASAFSISSEEDISHHFLDECFTGYDPKDSIHFYPISPLARQLRGGADRRLQTRKFGRITAFCATLPQRLLHSTSATR